MFVAGGIDHDARASMLVRQLIDEHDPKFGVGSMTCSIYDTAWVAMITKTTGEQSKWLFPNCFQYLLAQQQHDGGWATSAADGDAILNTLTSLLALCKHVASPIQEENVSFEDLRHKSDRAVYFLEAKFSQWDVSATTTQNFEVLIPKLLELLEEQGIEFLFPGRDLLFQLRSSSKSKLNSSSLYGPKRNVLSQSLEAFISELDFDRIKHHKISGSMMASPAATAVYLMHSTRWDEEAEAYLSHVVSTGNGTINGGVPCRYPTTVFELTTTLSLLLENGFKATDLSVPHLDNAASFLEDCLALESGVTGFAPYVESDADNTARAISTLSLLGKTCLPQGMIIRYETREFFKTYTQDRNPNFRTNCLVLKALLDLMPINQNHLSQIEKTVRFVANRWWTTNGQVEDSANVSSNYATMLMVKAFMRLVELRDRSLMPILDDPVLKDKVYLCLLQGLIQTMQMQNPDGSWGRGQRCESTSYGILTLAALSTLSSAPRIRSQLAQAIEKAQSYVAKNFYSSSGADRLWNEKVTSGSRVVYQAFILAALKVSYSTPLPGKALEARFSIPLAKVAIQTKYYSRQPWFANIPEWQIQAYLVESYLTLPQLRGVQHAVFPAEVLVEDRYFNSVPFAWIATGSIGQRFIGAEYLFQMMILTFLNRQFEEYAENVLGVIFAGCLFEIEEVVFSIFDEMQSVDHKDQCFCGGHSPESRGSSISTTGTISMSEARSVLYRYISHILNHPYVLMASHRDQDQLRSELLTFILSRINGSSEDHKNSGIEEGALARTAGSVSSDQTPHQLVFAFMSCMVGNQTPNGTVGIRQDFLDTPEQQYLVADLCRRLSIVSFMSKTGSDGPSPEAPYWEPSINSRPSSLSASDRVSFQSSRSSGSATSSIYSDNSSPVSPVSSVSSVPSRSPTRESPTKYVSRSYRGPISHGNEKVNQMSRLLQHERRCLKTCLQSLADAGTDSRTMNILKLYVDCSELCEQIFSDPNVGTYQASVEHHAIERVPTAERTQEVERTVVCDIPPVPPRRADRKGSVSAARAALEVAPLQVKRDAQGKGEERELPPQSNEPETRTPDFATKAGLQGPPSQDDIKLKGTSSMQREWNFNKANRVMRNHRASHSSSEVSRIERIMADIDGGHNRNASLPAHPALRETSQEKLPKPKINPMLPPKSKTSEGIISPSTNAATDGLAVTRSVPESKPFFHAEPTGRNASTTTTCSADAPKVSKLRRGSFQKNTKPDLKPDVLAHTQEEIVYFRQRQEQAKKVREMAEAAAGEKQRRKKNKLPKSQTAAQARAPVSVPVPAIPIDKGSQPTLQTIRGSKYTISKPIQTDVVVVPAEQTSTGAKATSDQTGWIKAPPPVNNNGEAALEAERVERLKKLKRASRLGGPRWRAPF